MIYDSGKGPTCPTIERSWGPNWKPDVSYPRISAGFRSRADPQEGQGHRAEGGTDNTHMHTHTAATLLCWRTPRGLLRAFPSRMAEPPVPPSLNTGAEISHAKEAGRYGFQLSSCGSKRAPVHQSPCQAASNPNPRYWVCGVLSQALISLSTFPTKKDTVCRGSEGRASLCQQDCTQHWSFSQIRAALNAPSRCHTFFTYWSWCRDGLISP